MIYSSLLHIFHSVCLLCFLLKVVFKKKKNIWLDVKPEKEIGKLAETIWGKKIYSGNMNFR